MMLQGWQAGCRLADFGEAAVASPPNTWQVLGCVWGGAQKPILVVKELETGSHC
jgi:hypothetical protein